MSREICKDCPFRVDAADYLSDDRKDEILDALKHDKAFHCHKTVEYGTGHPVVTSDSKLCMGSAVYMEKAFWGGSRVNVAYRFPLMLKEWTIEKLQSLYDQVTNVF